jgi:predicted GIY-YIG superfamily endonuclease
MYYCYILRSLRSGIFYIDTTDDVERCVIMHNGARFVSTKPNLPWELVWEGAYETEREARDFARYLKSNTGREYAYKKLISLLYNDPPETESRKRIFEA